MSSITDSIPLPSDLKPMNVVLINPYELGRPTFRSRATNRVAERIRSSRALPWIYRCRNWTVKSCAMPALLVCMLACTQQPESRSKRCRVFASWAPRAHVSVYGLYAPMNDGLFRSLGAKSVFGGEIEPDLVALADQLSNGQNPAQTEAVVKLSKVDFRVPDRSTLPDISRYTHLRIDDGTTRTVGFAEGTRGCKHLCRHCPVVPVYKGKFRIVPVSVVMADIRQQVAAGAEHISFGDPDFLNGPTHALRLVRALHSEFPNLTYDVTIKVEHIIKSPDLLPVLKETGCLFIISAVEAVDDEVLGFLDKKSYKCRF